MNQSARRELMLTARKLTMEHLDKLVDSFFAHLDDLIFEPAEVLSGDSTRSGFIYAVRDLKQLREPVSHGFVRETLKNLERFLTTDLTVADSYTDALQRQYKEPVSLQLMNHTELEEDLAVLTVISKGEQRYRNPLEKWNDLLASLTGAEKVSNADNPLGPSFLANQFREALAIWPADYVVRPVIYDVFYEYVITQLGDLYQGLIDVMLKAGVQPLEKSIQEGAILPGKSGGQSTAQKPAGKGVAASGSTAEDSETSLLGLVNLVSDLFDSQRRAPGLAAAEAGSTEKLAPMRPDLLVDVLARLQRQFAEEPVSDLQTAIDSNGEFKRTLQRQLGQAAQLHHQQVQSLDQHILDVVMMLFDFVLEDPVVPAPMKVVIARLQIPILQLAIHDRVFLSDRSHPARILLNSLSRAAVRWVDDGDHTASSLYGMIDGAVSRIVSSRVQDHTLYADVEREFTEYLRREEQAAAIAEERLNQLARGQERLTAARERVSRELDRLMRDPLPAAVYRILDEVWRDVLTLSLLRDGKDDLSWSRMIDVAERLIDSVRLRDEELERQKIMRSLPLLLADLREGFFSISYDASKTASMFKQLQLCHISVMRGISPQMQAVTWEPGQVRSPSDLDSGNGSGIQTADLLEIGHWLSWIEQDGSERRAKLSWRSEVADLLLFVDCRGRKVLEMTSEDLNGLMRDAQARVIEEIDEPVMDRAMRLVYDMLRQTASERSADMQSSSAYAPHLTH